MQHTQSEGRGLLSPEEVQAAQESASLLRSGLSQLLLGQELLIENCVACLLAKGHLLLEGLPGLGKTELVKGLSGLLGLEFKRVQFTPDLLPSDITGSHVLEESHGGGREFRFRQGPVFTNLLLADEINRASPKTQSALLEAMAERRVSLLGTTHDLPSPFFVLATQNPVDLEGTYPLPEAQLDRFTLKLKVPSVSAEVMAEIITTRPHGHAPRPEEVMSRARLLELSGICDRIYLPRAVAEWIGRIVQGSDPSRDDSPEIARRYLRFPASPRGAIALAATARAAALMAGKPNVGFEEVRKMAPAALGHRLLRNYQAGLDEISPEALVEGLLDAIPELDRDA